MNRTCLILALVLLAGCGGSDGPALYPVTGRLSKGGQPLAGVNVNFTPESGPASAGRTNEEGKFVLNAQSGKAGAVAGKHKVFLVDSSASALSGPVDMSNDSVREAMMQQRSGGTGKRGEMKTTKSEKFPADYGSAQSTPFEFTVEEKSNEFDLAIP